MTELARLAIPDTVPVASGIATASVTKNSLPFTSEKGVKRGSKTASKSASPKKYKTKTEVLDSGALRGVCSCGWRGNALAQSSGLTVAIAAVAEEIKTHKHLEKK